MKRNIGKFVRWTAIYAVILAVIIALNVVVSQFSLTLDIFFGQIGGGSTQSDTYVSQYDSDEALTEELVAFSQEVEQEAITLMRNDNEALPLEAGSEIGIFGVNEAGWSKVGGGSGGVDTSDYEHITLRSTLEDTGLAVTEDLYGYYEGMEESATATWDEIIGNVSLGDVSSKTGFFVFSSSGQEGSDLEEGELTLTDAQLNVLRGMNEAGYDKIVLVLNAANPLEMEFLKDSTIRVDAIIWVGNTGAAGLAAIGPVVAGEVNPSGHLVDTYDYLHSVIRQINLPFIRHII